MENPIISVIIPIYNAEQYLRQCLDSALSQTLREIEVLCIDDASTDGTPGILAEYAKRDDRVKVITNSTNLKADASRNLAINAARGEFICFIDSDDFLPDSGMFASLAELARRENLDLVMFQAHHFIEEGSSDILSAAFQKRTRQGVFEDDQCGKVMSGGEMLDLALKFGNYKSFIWMRLFRATLFHGTGLRFLEGGNNADTLLTPVATLLAKRAYAVNRVYYTRRIHIKSVMTSALENPNAMCQYFLACREILAEWKSEKVQAIVSASGSRSANDLARRNVQYMARIFTQMPSDLAQRELAALGDTPDDKMLAAHLMSVRRLSIKLSNMTNRLNRAVARRKVAVVRSKTKATKLKAVKKKLASTRKKLKRTVQQRNKRPNSIRGCVKFILRRLFGGK